MAANATCECGATFSVPASAIERTVTCACGKTVVVPLPVGFHVRIDGLEYGPYDEATLRQWARDGRLPRTAELSADGVRWERAGDRPGWFGAAYPAGSALAAKSAIDANGLTSEDRTMGLLAHLLGLFTGFIGPLVLFLATSAERKFVRHHAKQALIWHGLIVVLMAATMLVVFAGVFALATGNVAPIFFVFLFPVAVGIASLVFGIMAAVAANRGEWYRYPVVGRMFGG